VFKTTHEINYTWRQAARQPSEHTDNSVSDHQPPAQATEDVAGAYQLMGLGYLGITVTATDARGRVLNLGVRDESVESGWAGRQASAAQLPEDRYRMDRHRHAFIGQRHAGQ
jgi:hypothetical protein